jgi:hypothetical protein
MSQGASYVLDRTFTIDDAAGVTQYAAVVVGAAEGGCKKPAGSNAKQFLGFTQESQANQNKGVAVRVMGVSYAVAAGAIANGDWVETSGTDGKVASCEAAVNATPGTAAQVNVIGRALSAATTGGGGDVILVLIWPHTVQIAAS